MNYPRGKPRGIKMNRVIRACPVAPGDGTGVICLPCEIPQGYFSGAKSVD